MHTIRSGWVVQTFALAKPSESEGRKQRIRRSKEERKAHVASFIKKYQSSNDGNFPSLNLTQKEVGGSFYIVREIVREVIQENRVLGPGKLSPEDQKLLNADQLSEQFPVGSISHELQAPLTTSPNGTHYIFDEQSTSAKVVGITNEQIINGNQIDIKSEEAEDVKCIELQASEPSEVKRDFQEEMVASKATVNLLVGEPSEAKENSEEKTVAANAKVGPPEIEPLEVKENSEEDMFASKVIVNGLVTEPLEAKENLGKETVASKATVNPLQVKENIEAKLLASQTKLNPLAAEIKVETFPLRPITKPKDSSDARSGEVRDLTSNFGKTEAEEVKLGSPCVSSTTSVYSSELVSKDDAEEDAIVHNIRGNTNVEINESHNDAAMVFHNDTTQANDQSQAVAEIKAVNASNGAPTKYPSSTPKETNNKEEIHPIGSTKKGSNPVVDRINLESRERPSKTSADPEKNPLLAFFKSFVAAFVKFWSE